MYSISTHVIARQWELTSDDEIWLDERCFSSSFELSHSKTVLVVLSSVSQASCGLGELDAPQLSHRRSLLLEVLYRHSNSQYALQSELTSVDENGTDERCFSRSFGSSVRRDGTQYPLVWCTCTLLSWGFYWLMLMIVQSLLSFITSKC